MRTIPEVRAAMQKQAAKFEEAGLQDLADMVWEWECDLYRRSPVRRVVRKHYAPADQRAIAIYADRHPDMNYMEIASAFGCSIGRVSEALAGFRE